MPDQAAPVQVTAPDDFEEWRDVARRLVMAGLAPSQVVWLSKGQAGDLFARSCDPTSLAQTRPAPRALRQFLALAGKAYLHSDPARLELLYRLLWRLQDRPALLSDAADGDVRMVEDLARTVRRDIHKMRAFVRFRSLIEDDGGERLVAWFEPQHAILRANAAFFVNRFANMRWSILTPKGSLHWDCAVLHEGPPARREDGPAGDPAEDLWRTYYGSTFNPARLKVKAMLKEMPRRYWKNMPEAALIGGLIAGAQAREAAMVSAGSDQFAQAPRPESLAAIAAGIAGCRRCPIGCNGTRAVPGEGPAAAQLMIVGEQPGDTEEVQGRPFIGPAGQLLAEALDRAGIDRGQSYLTNAVKHFKFQQRGKVRLHQSPTAGEIDHCRWWLDRERELVRPRIVLTLGASALRGVTGRTASLEQARKAPRVLQDGAQLWSTVHPSYLLRLDGAAQQREAARFGADLACLSERIAAGGVVA